MKRQMIWILVLAGVVFGVVEMREVSSSSSSSLSSSSSSASVLSPRQRSHSKAVTTLATTDAPGTLRPPMPSTIEGISSASKVRRLRKPEILALNVRTDITHRFATTLITQRVINLVEKNKTSVFEAYIPKAAFVVAFAIAIDGRIHRGEIVERPSVYDVDRERKLLSSVATLSARSRGCHLFRAEVVLRPNSKADFNLTYQELLQRRLGAYEHVIVVSPGQVVNDLRVDVKVRESVEILNVTGGVEMRNSTMDSSQVRIRRSSRNVAHATFAPSVTEQAAWSEAGLSAPVVVRYDVKRQLDAGEVQIRDGYFVHYFAPVGLHPIDRNIIFILDSSSSMSGTKQSQLSEAMSATLESLRPSDMFNVIFYSTSVRYWNREEGVVSATPSNIQNAKEFIRAENFSSGSNMNDALLRGIDFLVKQEELEPLATRNSMIILLTDGNPTTGITEYDRILSNVRQANGARVSIFAVALGNQVRFAFLRKLAQQNRGFARRINRAVDAAEETRLFYSEISTPLLENVRVRYDDVVEDTSLSETDFPAYFAGSEIVVVGHLKTKTGYLTAKVSGGSTQGYMSLDARPKIPKSERDKTAGFNFAEKAWVHSTIRKLLRKTLEYINETVITSAVTTVRRMSLQHVVMTPLMCMDVSKLKELKGPICLADPDEDLPEDQASASANSKSRNMLKTQQRGHRKSGNSANRHRAFVDNDPHFLVMVDGLKEGVCFDVDGKPGLIYQLIHDKGTGLAVNALITGKAITNEFPNVKTYLGKIAILYDRASVVVDPESILVNSAVQDWKKNATVNVSENVFVEITSGRYVTVTVKNVAVLRILRHMVKPSHPYKVSYLGFYVEDESGLSEHIHGLIGQFTHQAASAIHSSLELRTSFSNVRLQVRLTFSGPHMSHRTVGAVLADRRDMDLKKQTPCWHVPRNGAGLIKGNPEDYIVPYLHYKKSPFIHRVHTTSNNSRQ